jgi:tRNA-uridine 2-sulfurtransferase
MKTIQPPPHFKSSDRIAVALSGGVDSAVCLHLLVSQGYQVDAFFMKNWKDDQSDCTADQDLQDAKKICQQIKVKLIEVNFQQEYWQDVFQVALDTYYHGWTPNPDVLCNQKVKFQCFFNHIRSLGYQWLATGHYANISYQPDLPAHTTLQCAHDHTKDQSYFLCCVPSHALHHSWFPIGDLKKSEVRELAKSFGLHVHQKKDSTGLCFVGERPFKPFLNNYLIAKPGKIVDLKGQMVGTHDGLIHYTIGQRKGLSIGGKTNDSKPWYVVYKNQKMNELVVCQGIDHPKLYCQSLRTQAMHWIGPPISPRCKTLTAKVRYRQSSTPCKVSIDSENNLAIIFDQPVFAVTCGQYLALYDQDRCIGGAVICQVNPTKESLTT